MKPDVGSDDPRDAEVAATDVGGTLRAVVRAGGTPTREQAAALAAALLTVQRDARSEPSAVSGWRRAALLESVGHRRFAAPADLDGPAGQP